jgi:hypothetical protein
MVVLGLREAVMSAPGHYGPDREAGLRLLDLVYMSSDASTRHRGLVTFLLWDEPVPPPSAVEEGRGEDNDEEEEKEDRAWSALAEALGRLAGPSFNPRSFLGRIDGISLDPAPATSLGAFNDTSSFAMHAMNLSEDSIVEGGSITGEDSFRTPSDPIERICERAAAANQLNGGGEPRDSIDTQPMDVSTDTMRYLGIGIAVSILVGYLMMGVAPVAVSTSSPAPCRHDSLQDEAAAVCKLPASPSDMPPLSPPLPLPLSAGRRGVRRTRGARASGGGSASTTAATAATPTAPDAPTRAVRAARRAVPTAAAPAVGAGPTARPSAKRRAKNK